MKTLHRLAVAACACAVIAGPAGADTLKEVIAHGMVLTIDQIGDIDITYNQDGTFVGKNEQLEGAIGGPLTGKWRIDGDKLCTTADIQPTESCQAYPTDKKSGDTFELTSDQGTAKIKIK